MRDLDDPPEGLSPGAATEAVARRLHAEWGVGGGKCQNGVLVLLALNARCGGGFGWVGCMLCALIATRCDKQSCRKRPIQNGFLHFVRTPEVAGVALPTSPCLLFRTPVQSAIHFCGQRRGAAT
jgi:hypothetical protein